MVSDDKIKILLVDDEIDLLEVLAERCADHFETVFTAKDGLEAMEICKKEKISIIISDINMPNMKGDEFLRLLRASGDMTPVVFLTGHGEREIVLSTLRLGGADLLDKPVRFDDLLDTIYKILEIERRRSNLDYEQKDSSAEEAKKRKMIGLLQVANEKKKI